MNSVVLIDANVLLRYLLGDHPTLSPRAKEQFAAAGAGKISIYLDEIVVAETIWVLSSFYKVARPVIAEKLELVVSQKWMINPRKSLILEALSLFRSSTFAYIDCWLLVVSRKKRLRLETFDEKLRKYKMRIPTLDFRKPGLWKGQVKIHG